MVSSYEPQATFGEWELGLEAWEAGDVEEEEFFRGLADLIRRGVQSPTFRKMKHLTGKAMTIARIIGQVINPPQQPVILPPPPQAVQSRRDERRGRQRPPDDGELGLGRVTAPARPSARLMEHLGHEAAHAPTQVEAEAFLAALVPLAARVVPQAAPAIMRSAPDLIRGITGITGVLRRDAAMRPLIRTIPTMMRVTAAAVGSRRMRGQPVTPQDAVRLLTVQAYRMLSDPRRSVRAWQQSQPLDRAWHRTAFRS